MVVYGGRRRTHVLESASSFAKLQLSEGVRRALLLAGYRRPCPIQERAIPLARSGRDLVVRAEADSGKTLVFALACLDRVDAASSHPQVLVLTPDGDVARRHATDIQKIASNLPYPHLSCGVFSDHTFQTEDRRQLRHPSHVIVGTPGRLERLRQKGLLSLNRIRLVVLDEADRLFREKHDVLALISRLPEGRQSLAFASTLDPEILDEIEGVMDDPKRLFVDEKISDGDRHCYGIVEGGLRNKASATIDFLHRSKIGDAVVYCNDEDAVDILSTVLNENGYRSMHTADGLTYVKSSIDCRVSIGIDDCRTDRSDVVLHLQLPTDTAAYGRRVEGALSVCFVSALEQEQLQEIIEGMDRRLIELPEDCVRMSMPSSPKFPQDLSWTGGSKSEFLKMTERLEKRYPCCHHWDPSSFSRSSSREDHVKYQSEGSQELGSHHRRINCIRLPSRLSRSTSASSVVYSEEGECECFDEDDWSNRSTATPPLYPPELPPEMPSVTDFASVRDRYEEWRKAYAEWHANYEAWYKAVTLMPHQLP